VPLLSPKRSRVDVVELEKRRRRTALARSYEFVSEFLPKESLRFDVTGYSARCGPPCQRHAQRRETWVSSPLGREAGNDVSIVLDLLTGREGESNCEQNAKSVP
jgi:hypothetical protein